MSDQCAWLKAEQPEVLCALLQADLLWGHRNHPSLSLLCTLPCPSDKALPCFLWH